MNKIFALLLSVLLLAPVLSYAEKAHHDDTNASTSKAKPTADKTYDSGPSSMMMDNMKKMKDQMAQLQAAKDPKEREKLMQDHMQTMQETMKMMHDSKGMMADRKGGKPMHMMQMMMDQMMEHQKAMQDMGK
jgi:periplasmic protein CpxP/Spy